LVILLSSLLCPAVETGAIDNVRNKQILSDSDLESIDEFVNQAVAEILNIKNFSNAARQRAVILSRKTNNKESSREQYVSQFTESARNAVENTLSKANQIQDKQQRFKVLVNLFVLVDGLEKPEISQPALDYLDYPQKSVRYWAVHCLTNPAIAEQLNNSGDYNELKQQILSGLEKAVENSGYEETVLITRFASKLNNDNGLLKKITHQRLKKYEKWNVDNVYTDTEILSGLCDKALSAPADKSEYTRLFCQLYSYLIQRYIEGRDILTDKQNSSLASVIIETERSLVGEKMQIIQVDLKKAIENNDYTNLLLEHNRLLGDDTQKGKIALAYNFSYKNGSTAPEKLSEPK
jgi:hypothetical protein